MSDTPRICETCRFWSQAGTGKGGAFEGRCRRHAPVLVQMQTDTEDADFGWPNVEGMDWCGEHEFYPESWSGGSLAPSGEGPIQ